MLRGNQPHTANQQRNLQKTRKTKLEYMFTLGTVVLARLCSGGDNAARTFPWQPQKLASVSRWWWTQEKEAAHTWNPWNLQIRHVLFKEWTHFLTLAGSALISPRMNRAVNCPNHTWLTALPADIRKWVFFVKLNVTDSQVSRISFTVRCCWLIAVAGNTAINANGWKSRTPNA